jgi:hypothetical protein
MTDSVYETLNEAGGDGVDIVIGIAPSIDVEAIRTKLANGNVFTTELDWLTGSDEDYEAAISRLLLVDNKLLLISTGPTGPAHEQFEESAVYAKGLGNGIVVIIRRMLESGLATGYAVQD